MKLFNEKIKFFLKAKMFDSKLNRLNYEQKLYLETHQRFLSRCFKPKINF